MQIHLPDFAKNRFPAIISGHFEMQKCICLGNNVRSSDFIKIFNPQGIYTTNRQLLFAKNHFPAMFGGHHEYLCKMQKCNYLYAR